MAKTGITIKFEAKLCRPADGDSSLFLRLPQEASNQLATRSLVSVEGTLNGCIFAATLLPDGEGGHWLRVKPEWSEATRVQAGDFVELEISPARVEPEPDVPDDLRQALASMPAALSVWEKTTPLARRDWIHWLTTGKRSETRQIRLEKMIDMLSKGKRRICCFDPSGIANKKLLCPVAADELFVA